MKNEENIDVIGIKELFFEFLKKWNFILICAIIIGILFSGFRIVDRLIFRVSTEYIDQADTFYQNDTQKYDSKMENLNISLKSTSEQLEEINNYIEQSELMKINPYSKKVASVDLIISVNEDNILKKNSLINAYISYFKNGRATTSVSDSLQMKSQYLQELVTINKLNDTQDLNVTNNNQSINKTESTTDTLHLSVESSTQELSEKALYDLINECKKDFYVESNNICLHSLDVIEQGTITKWDHDLLNKQNEVYDMKKTLTDDFVFQTNELAELKKPKMMTYSDKMVLLSGFKYMLLGVFVGGVVSSIVAFICCYFSDKILSIKDLQEKLNGKLLLACNNFGKKSFKYKINNWLSSLEYSDDSFSTDVITKLIVRDVMLKQTVSRIFITGRADEFIKKQLQIELQFLLSDIEINQSSTIMTSVNGLDEMIDSDYIILTEQIDRSTNSSIEKERIFILNQKKDIDYCILYY